MVPPWPFGRLIRAWWLDVLLLAGGAAALAWSLEIEPPADLSKGDPVLALWLIALACLTAWLLLRVPRWQVGRLRSEGAPQRLESENEARRTLATILGGAALLAGLYFTSVQIKEQRKQAADDRSLGERRLVTEMYVKAVELLGPIDGKNLGTKIGAIYALEEIAKNSESLHRPIMELLQAYVKERSPLPKDRVKPSRAPRDVQAAIVVMGRRQVRFDGPTPLVLELSNVNLNYVNFDGLNFEYTNFAGANVASSSMKQTKLCGANFRGADMTGVEIVGGDQRLAYLDGPTYIKGGNLQGAVLQWPEPVRYIDGNFDAVALLGADASAYYVEKVKSGGGHIADDQRGTAEWRAHMKRRLSTSGAFDDGCGRLPTPAWSLVTDPAPQLVSK